MASLIMFDGILRLGGPREALPSSLSSLGHSLLCIVVCALVSPLVLYGHLRILFATKRTFPGLKFTAFKIAEVRAELNRMGLRKDPLSEQLLRALPWVPRHACRCAFSYLELISRFGLKWHRYPLSGAALAEPAWRDVISLRTQLIDGTISELKAEQLVILGAGFDARALLPLESAARRFEVDLPPTQKAKVAAINAAEIDAASTSFVPVDFSKEESWLDKLREAGFDPKKKTVFVWEGVTYYLEAKAVDATIELLKRCCSGSTIVFDYFSTDVVEGKLLPMIAPALRRAGEPLLSGIGAADDEDAPCKWVADRGLKLRQCFRGGKKGKRWGGVLSASVV